MSGRDEKVAEHEGYSRYQCAENLPEEPTKKTRTGNQGKKQNTKKSSGVSDVLSDNL